MQFDLGEIIVGGLGAQVDFDYEIQPAFRRRAVISEIYGPHPAFPEYVRGREENSSEDLIYRIDRMRAVQIGGIDVGQNVQHAFASMAAMATGRPLWPAPQTWALIRPVSFVLEEHDGSESGYEGVLTAGEWLYRETGPCLRLDFMASRAGGRRGKVTVRVGEGGYGRRLRQLIDLDTGQSVTDPLSWLNTVTAECEV